MSYANMPVTTTQRWWQRYAPVHSPSPAIAGLKQLIWLYWLLWLFEGALRKWVMPQFAGPLLLVRDPVALLIILRALHIGVWRVNGWTWILWLIGFGSFTLTIGQEIPLPVAVVGLRTVILHMPLIFIIGRVLTREDVERISNQVLDFGFPMAVLMAMQFVADTDSFLNVGAGRDSSQIGGVGEGKIRAAGVFSFISGAVQFFTLVCAFWLARFGRNQRIGWAFGLAGMSILIAINVALSRSMLGACAVVFVAFLAVLLTGRVPVGRVILLTVCAFVFTGLAAGSSILREGNELLLLRFQSATDFEGSFLQRAFTGFYVSWDVLVSGGLLGHGLGLGTNMGAALVGQYGEGVFLLGEGEWERVIMEMGFVLGLVYVFWRIALFLTILKGAFTALSRNDGLPLLLLAAGGISLINGQSGQPTTLGFIVISAGMTIAASHSNARQQRSPQRRAHQFAGQRYKTHDKVWGHQ